MNFVYFTQHIVIFYVIGLADNTHLSQPTDRLPYTTLMYTSGPGGENNAPRRNLTGVDVTDFDFKQSAVVKMSVDLHGGEDVPIYAVGPMAHLFHGVHEQHYIAHVMAYASCVGQNKKHCRQHASRHQHETTAVSGRASGIQVTVSSICASISLWYFSRLFL